MPDNNMQQNDATHKEDVAAIEQAYGDTQHNLSRPAMPDQSSMPKTAEALKVLGAGQPYNGGEYY